MNVLLASLLAIATLAGQPSSYAPDTCLRLVQIGSHCIEVPCAYRVVQTHSLVDAWLGYIEPPAGDWQVFWSSGMTQSLLSPSAGREVLWSKQEDLVGRKVKLGRVRSGELEVIVLASDGFELSIDSSVSTPAEKLWDVARAFRRLPLPNCGAPENEAVPRLSNNRLNLPAHPVTSVACATTAPGRPAG